jgi:hypothetical protein
MIPRFPIPLAMKLAYGFRHIIERQDLFKRVERTAREEIERLYRGSPDIPAVEISRIFDISEFNKQRFDAEGGFGSPFVIRGLLSTRALEWAELRDRFGDSLVPVHPRAELGDDWQYHRVIQMRLSDAMRAMENGRPLSVVSTSQVFTDYSQLLATPKLAVLREVFGVEFLRLEMFVAGAGTGSSFHCAGGGNFYHMLYGRKRWLLVAPEDSFAMYPTIGRNRRSAIICSPINSDSYEEEQRRSHPMFAKIPKYGVTLEAGDILFVPGWWWHEVKNLTSSIGAPCRSYLAGRNDFFFMLSLFSGHGLKYLSRVLISNISGKGLCLMTDGIPRESFGTKFRRGK